MKPYRTVALAKSVAEGNHPMQRVADAMALAFNNKFEAELMVKCMFTGSSEAVEQRGFMVDRR